MQGKDLAALLIALVLSTQGAVIPEDDMFTNALQTLLTKPEMLIDTFGLIREETSDQGSWDFDYSLGRVTLQIKFKEPANTWKGGHVHFEIQDLKSMIPMARSERVNFDISFDGGNTPGDLIFNLKVEYTLEHAFEEKGIFELSRKPVDSEWIIKMSNKKKGGGNGKRIFPLLEHTFQMGNSASWTGTYHSDRFQNVKLDMVRNPEGEMNSTFSGTLWGKSVTITLDDTRNGTINKSKLLINLDSEGIQGRFVCNTKSKEMLKFKGDITLNTYKNGGQFNFGGNWKLDLQNGTRGMIRLNLSNGYTYYRHDFWMDSDWSNGYYEIRNGHRRYRVDVSYKRNNESNWGGEIKFTWDSLTYRVDVSYKRNNEGNWVGEIKLPFEKDTKRETYIRLLSEEIDANTKKFALIVDTKSGEELLKYVNTISAKKEMLDGHNELVVTMKDELNKKTHFHFSHLFSFSIFYRCGIIDRIKGDCCSHSFGNKAYPTNQQMQSNISFSLNLDEPWHMLFLANVIDQDRRNMLEVEIDTKSHQMKEPYVLKLKTLLFLFELEARYFGKNIVSVLKKDNQEELRFDFTRLIFDQYSEDQYTYNTYNISIIHEDKNGDGKQDFLDIKAFKNGPKVYDFEVDMSSIPYNFTMEYPASMAFLSQTSGKIEGAYGNGKMHFTYNPGSGENLEIDVLKTHKDSGTHENYFAIKVQRNKEVYYDFDNIVTYGVNRSQLELDVNSRMLVSTKSAFYSVTCGIPQLEFLCFQNRTMLIKLHADRSAPYKVEAFAKVDKDGIEVFKLDMQTKSSPYKVTVNWPIMRAIVAPDRNEPLQITADHTPGESIFINTNIRGFQSFSVEKMPIELTKVTLNGKELVQTAFQKGDRSIIQTTTLSNGNTLTSTCKWGNEDSLWSNNFQLDLDGSERKLVSLFEWNLNQSGGNWKLDVTGENPRWGKYNIHRTGEATNGQGIWTLDIDGTSLWRGKNIQIDAFIKLDTNKVRNGKLDAITAKLIKIVDGNKYQVKVMDGQLVLGDLFKIGTVFKEMMS